VKRFLQLVYDNLLCSITLAFAVGIAGSSLSGNTPWQTFLLIALGLAVIILSGFHRRLSATVALVLFFTVLGNFYGSKPGHRVLETSDISFLVQKKQEAVLIGTLISRQGFNGETSKAVIDCRSLRLKDTTTFVPTTGRVVLSLKAPWPQAVLPGNRIVVRAIFDRPHNLMTAGSFDYRRYLQERGIGITGFISSPLFIHNISSKPSLQNIARFASERMRVKIGTVINDTLSPQLAGFYKAILIGDRSGISNHLFELFKEAGCMHILSISGMHMSIIGVFLFAAFYWLLKRSTWLILHSDVKRIAAAACLPFLIYYTLLAGANIPVIRSLLMSIVMVFALCLNRQRSIFATLALAMLILLVWNPQALFSASFQLTFAAVASIAAIFPKLLRFMSCNKPQDRYPHPLSTRLKNWTIAALMISISATIGTAPLILYFFNRLSLAGPFANLVVEPLVCFWSLPLGFIACPLIFLYPPLAVSLLHLGSLGLSLSIHTIELFQKVPLEALWLPTPSPVLIFLYYGCLLILLLSPISKKNLRRLSWTTLAITIFLFRMPPAELLKHFKEKSTITVIDVGQGSANLIEFPTGKRALIDGGGPSSPKFDIGEQIISRFLWKKGITSIDSIIITHADADHYNGLPFIIRHFSPKSLWINGSPGHDPNYTKLLNIARDLQLAIHVSKGNDRCLSVEGAKLSIIANPLLVNLRKTDRNRILASSRLSENEKGLIIKFTDHRFAALFPGDIDKRVEKLLVMKSENISADVLLSPHHGSSTSNSEDFLRTVDPDFLIVSAGRRKKGIFPARDLKEKSQRLGIQMLTTALSGCVVITTDGTRFSVATGDGITPTNQVSGSLPTRQPP